MAQNKTNQEASIFKTYYTDVPFVDRYERDKAKAVDVIIPIIHTNELWEINLKSMYREIPINRILIADGGCIDNSLEIVKKFPRVEIHDHKAFKSLGYSIRKLVESVKTDWFIYVHSDVFLPEGWFDEMAKHQPEYDWFGCRMRHTIMVEYDDKNDFRPYAGSQMGKKEAFLEGLKSIDDDYVYRQEDFVFSEMIERSGYKEGKIDDTFHYHQTMFRKTKGFDLDINKVVFDINKKPEEEYRASIMQIKGTIKYLKPEKRIAAFIVIDFVKLSRLGRLNWSEIKDHINATNPGWMKFYGYWKTRIAYDKVISFLGNLKRRCI
ncbi:MAG: glycosyltransferase family 2 protein [bacterium]